MLMLHQGGRSATLDDLRAVPLPERTGTYTPINHADLAERVKAAYAAAGFTLTGESYGLNRHGSQMFGVCTFTSADVAGRLVHGQAGQAHPLNSDVAVGFRNCMNKRLSVGLVAGGRVFVCDNLALSGKIRQVRKHSLRLLEDLETILGQVVADSTTGHRALAGDFQRMWDRLIDDRQAYQMIGEAWGGGLLNATQAQEALRQWRKPARAEWQARNVWRAYSGMTEALKAAAPANAMEQYVGVHRLAVSYAPVVHPLDPAPAGGLTLR